jgi:adenine/guanine/hypoxanthine permease
MPRYGRDDAGDAPPASFLPSSFTSPKSSYEGTAVSGGRHQQSPASSLSSQDSRTSQQRYGRESPAASASSSTESYQARRAASTDSSRPLLMRSVAGDSLNSDGAGGDRRNCCDNVFARFERTRAFGVLDSYFHVTQLGSNMQQEVLGGISTFLVCIYILQFESAILSDAGMPTGGVFAATCLTAGFGSIFMGVGARVPIVIAPGMGMNVFFAHVLVNSLGVHWRDALGMVFVQGWLLALLAFLGIRNKVLKAFGSSIRVGVALGVVLFLAFVGMTRIDIGDGVHSPVFVPTFRLGLAMATMFFIVLCLVRFRMKSAFIVGIILCTGVSIVIRAIWCPDELALDWNPPALSETVFKLRFDWDIRSLYLVPLLLFHHLFDSAATILSILQMAYLGFSRTPSLPSTETSSTRLPTVDEFTNLLANSKQARNALMIDGIVSSCGAVLGVSTSTSYIESAIGVAVGAKTGICAIVAGLLFLSGLLLRPIYMLVPPEATGPVLFLTAVMVCCCVPTPRPAFWVALTLPSLSPLLPRHSP